MTTSPFIQNVVCRLSEYVSTKSIQSLNNEGLRYDNITLIRQSRKQLVRIIVRLVGIENKTNLRAKQQSGKRHHYEESVEKAVARKDRQFKALVTTHTETICLECIFVEIW